MTNTESSLTQNGLDTISLQPTCNQLAKDTNIPCKDTISRRDAIDAILGLTNCDTVEGLRVYVIEHDLGSWWSGGVLSSIGKVERLPSVEKAQLSEEDATKDATSELISRQAAIDEIKALYEWHDTVTEDRTIDHLKRLPSAQPERTCVNCGRTANNGGWYADGGTRCPIEEHYALPKDGYCHLWEKRNVTDDDYTERREE